MMTVVRRYHAGESNRMSERGNVTELQSKASNRLVAFIERKTWCVFRGHDDLTSGTELPAEVGGAELVGGLVLWFLE